MTKRKTKRKARKKAKKKRAKTGRPRGRAKAKPRPPQPAREAEYKQLAAKLMTDSRLESATATAEWTATVVDCHRHLDDLRDLMTKGTITSDERRVVPSLMARRDQALRAMGLDKHKPKGRGNL
jgi:hypothetical protein